MSGLFTEVALCSIPSPETGAEQMAIDEALLNHCTLPTLRIYRWIRSEVTFGYPMKWQDVLPVAAGRPMTRRSTGGGIVEHGDDTTICLAIPRSDPLSQFAAADVYATIHKALQRIFPIETTMATDGCGGAKCFAAPTVHDLLLRGRKILGGALRRGRPGVLYQGSLQLEQICDASELARALSDNVKPWIMPDDWARAVTELRAGRYDSPAWNRKR